MYGCIIMMSVLVIIIAAADAHASQTTTTTHAVEGGVEIVISHPDALVAGGGSEMVSILVKNNGWEDKQEISFAVSASDESIVPDPADAISIGRLAEGGSYGEGISIRAPADASPGTHYLNLRYAHVLVANNEDPQDPFYHDMAIPITISPDAAVVVWTKAPESIFAGAEFPITVEVVSEYADISDVRIAVVPPPNIEFQSAGGDTAHEFSKVQKGQPVSITTRIAAVAQEVHAEYKLPFEIVVSYVDDAGEEKTESRTASVVLRPRTFMELTTDGGIWIGDIFIAPYVSIGTIVGVPVGAIISVMLRRKLGGGGGKRERGKARRGGGSPKKKQGAQNTGRRDSDDPEQ